MGGFYFLSNFQHENKYCLRLFFIYFAEHFRMVMKRRLQTLTQHSPFFKASPNFVLRFSFSYSRSLLSFLRDKLSSKQPAHLCILVAVRNPVNLHLHHTFHHEDLKCPHESKDVCITTITAHQSGDLLLVDTSNNTIKTLRLSSGALCPLFHERSQWALTSGLLVGAGKRLLIVEGRDGSPEKRLLVAEKTIGAAMFTQTQEIPLEENSLVCT